MVKSEKDHHMNFFLINKESDHNVGFFKKLGKSRALVRLG